MSEASTDWNSTSVAPSLPRFSARTSTLVILREKYPSKEALDAAGTGSADALVETFDQLDELLVTLGEGSGQ